MLFECYSDLWRIISYRSNDFESNLNLRLRTSFPELEISRAREFETVNPGVIDERLESVRRDDKSIDVAYSPLSTHRNFRSLIISNYITSWVPCRLMRPNTRYDSVSSARDHVQFRYSRRSIDPRRTTRELLAELIESLKIALSTIRVRLPRRVCNILNLFTSALCLFYGLAPLCVHPLARY